MPRAKTTRAKSSATSRATRSTTATATELKLAEEVHNLAKENRNLAREVRKVKDLEFVRILKRPWKFMLLSLVKGIMIGFGSVLGATVLVAIFIYILAQISFVPIIGDFVQDIMGEIQLTQSSDSSSSNTDIFDQFNAKKEELAQ